MDVITHAISYQFGPNMFQTWVSIAVYRPNDFETFSASIVVVESFETDNIENNEAESLK